MTELVAALGALAIVLIAWAFDRSRRGQQSAESLTAERAAAQRLVDESRQDGERVRREAETKAQATLLEARAQWEGEAREQRKDAQAIEKRIAQKEQTLDQKIATAAQREAEVTKTEDTLRQKGKQIDERAAEATQLVDQVRQKLEETAGLTRDEAKRSLLDQMLDEARHDGARHIRQIEAEAREEAERRAQRALSSLQSIRHRRRVPAESMHGSRARYAPRIVVRRPNRARRRPTAG